MRLAVFHELDCGGAKRAVTELGKRLKKVHVIDLYYVSNNEDKDIKKYFNDVYFFRFNTKYWYGNNWRIKLYKDTIELIKLYLLH